MIPAGLLAWLAQQAKIRRQEANPFLAPERIATPTIPIVEIPPAPPATSPTIPPIPQLILPPAPTPAAPPTFTPPAPPKTPTIPPWTWALLGFLLTAGGRRAAPALLAAPFQAQALAQQALAQQYAQDYNQAQQDYENALRQWQLGEQLAQRRYETQQRAALENYRQRMRAWLQEQENTLKQTLAADKQRFQLQLKELDIAAKRELAEGRDATAIQQTILRQLLAAANNPQLTAQDRQNYLNLANYYAQVGELPPTLPTLQPSIPEQLAPSRIALTEAQTELTQARTKHTLADIGRIEAQTQFLLAKAADIAQRDQLTPTRKNAANAARDPILQQQFISLRNQIETLGQLTNRALIGYQQAVRDNNPDAADYHRAQYEEYRRQLQNAIRELQDLQRRTGVQLIHSPPQQLTPDQMLALLLQAAAQGQPQPPAAAPTQQRTPAAQPQQQRAQQRTPTTQPQQPRLRAPGASRVPTDIPTLPPANPNRRGRPAFASP